MADSPRGVVSMDNPMPDIFVQSPKSTESTVTEKKTPIPGFMTDTGYHLP